MKGRLKLLSDPYMNYSKVWKFCLVNLFITTIFERVYTKEIMQTMQIEWTLSKF